MTPTKSPIPFSATLLKGLAVAALAGMALAAQPAAAQTFERPVRLVIGTGKGERDEHDELEHAEQDCRDHPLVAHAE